MIVTGLVFLLILGLLVFVHEFGHYWVAKRSGIRVHEFAFGFRPRLFSWRRGETLYAINLLPFGGYVRLEGEQEDTGKEGAFMAKSPGVRARVLVAGVVMNLILAWFLLTLAYGFGSPALTPSFALQAGDAQTAEVVIANVIPDSPAAAVGLQAGDSLLAVNGQGVTSATDLVDRVKSLAGQEVQLTYKRNNETRTLQVTPRVDPPAGQGALGVAPGEIRHVKVAWHKAPVVALQEVWSEIKQSFVGFVQFVSKLVGERQVSEDVSGIVGIGVITGEVRQMGIGPLLQFIALISTNLAVINILPILPLDGGHLLFTAIEAVRRKPVPDMYRQWVAIAGLGMVLLLFLIVTYHDVLRFF